MVTIEQATTEREFHRNGCCFRSIGPRGGVTQRSEVWRRNGATKLWKTRPTEFRIPVKFGLRTYDYITQTDLHRFHTAAECPLNDPTWSNVSEVVVPS